MPQDLPPSGGYAPVQYKVLSLPTHYFKAQLRLDRALFEEFANTTAAQPPSSRLQTSVLPDRRRRNNDIWVLESRKRN